MKINANPEWVLEINSHAHNSISMNNDRLVSGMRIIHTSPVLEDVSDEDIHKKVLELLEKADITEVLREIEDDNLSKLGPRSIAIPWSERKESLFSYFRANENFDQTEGYLHLKEMDSSFHRNGHLRPVALARAVANLIPSSNSGLPFMVRKSTIDLAKANAALGMQDYPCVLYTRTAEQKKTRNIWGFPIKDTLKEARFLIPYIEMEKELPHRAALKGPDYVDAAVSRILYGKSDDDSVVCVDFEAFDASVSGSLINWAFSMIASHFQKGYFNEIQEICERFKTIPIYTPDGQIEGSHGVPSGSGFTNTVDSEVQLQASGETRSDRCQIQGDDGIYIRRGKEIQSTFDRFERNGLRLNRDKTRVFSDQQGVYLQRYYHPQYKSGSGLGGVYPISRALARIKYLESFTDFDKEGIEGSDFFALRTIMILENCKHHPCFVDLVRYVQSQDKFRLNYSDRGLKQYSRLLASKARAGQWISQEESRAKGLSSFATVQVLSEA